MAEVLLNEAQQKFLLKLARDAIIYYLDTKKHIQVKPDDPVMEEERGAFVTLKTNKSLRGCIGYPLPTDPLYTTIIDTAILAATKDNRFQPLTKEELPDTRIEISVLSLPKSIKDISEIQVGMHGIIISQGMNKGLLLPQVPVEWNWDLKTYLRHGCLKAGLEENAWKKKAKVEIFSAQVFSD
jgi:AmmeMemoRadiSam system protein A